MYSLGFIQRHRPDIHIILDQSAYKYHPAKIIQEIEQGLLLNKVVALFFWDEDFITAGPFSDQLNQELSAYKDQPVYLCSHLIGDQKKIYSIQRSVPIKVVYVPWWYMSCVPFMIAKKSQRYQGPVSTQGHNWACLINRPDPHKDMLINGLQSRKLSGLLRHQNIDPSTRYYQHNDRAGWNSSHDMKRSLIWDDTIGAYIDHLSRNIPRLEQILSDCPMVVNPESTGGIFPITEKSWWPIVLDRMFVIWARPGIMHDLQEYIPYDLSLYLDLEFDSINGYTTSDHQRRLDCLLDKNFYVMSHARDIYPSIQHHLQQASADLGENIYRKFCQALDQLV